MKRLIVLSILGGACGSTEKVKIVEISSKDPAITRPPLPTPVQTTLDFNFVQPLLQENCAQAGCHAGAGYLQDEDKFMSSNAPREITSGSMPPPYSPDFEQWTPEIKAQVSQYIEANR